MKSRFDEIVGLRIYLAAWVAIDHGLETAGFLNPTNALLRVLLDGGSSVAVFIIISGFVITHLIETAHEPYGKYLVRRAFRLYPVYIIACICGFFTADSWVRLAAMSPWSHALGWSEYTQNILARAQQLHTNPLGHIAAHLFMMHGAIPDQILAFSASTILPAAWSISLEWQFYLVAPLVLFGLRTRTGVIWTTIASLMLFIITKNGYLGEHEFRSFIGSAVPYFAVGIASRLAIGWASGLKLNPLAVSAVGCAALLMIGKDPTPLLVWTIFYSFLVWQDDGLLSRLFRFLTAARPIVLFGEASYSLYLIHRPIQILLGIAAITTIGRTQHGMLMVQMAAIAIALLISLGLYFGVEKPFIRMGKQITGGRSRACMADVASPGP
ncbi:MAG: acyltransferase [Formivibrio sp.]|nr:acyltransferase [Formivibrio sp.]